MSADEYQDCVNNQLDSFSRYDQYVDVVSCWEEFLITVYESDFPNFHFDRFPTLPRTTQAGPVTPDFAVFFSSSYGIVFEISRTFPIDDEAFTSELSQLEAYDEDLQFRNGEGTREIPDTHDIVLLVSTTDSQTIEHRIAQAIANGTLDVDRNIILMDYTYLDQDRKPQYQFRRLSRVENNFRDDVFPPQKRLSRKLSMEGGEFESIYSPPDAFYEYKATGVLCNDSPPDLYLVCYLWQNVFYDFLTEAEKHVWQRRNPQKIIEVEVSVPELTNRLNEDYIPDGTVSRSKVENCLQYLVVAGVSERTDDEEYEVRFRNLKEKRREYSDVRSARTSITDLAHLFSEWYCETRVSSEEEEFEELLSVSDTDETEEPEVEAPQGRQAGLGDFGSE